MKITHDPTTDLEDAAIVVALAAQLLLDTVVKPSRNRTKPRTKPRKFYSDGQPPVQPKPSRP